MKPWEVCRKGALSQGRRRPGAVGRGTLWYVLIELLKLKPFQTTDLLLETIYTLLFFSLVNDGPLITQEYARI